MLTCRQGQTEGTEIVGVPGEWEMQTEMTEGQGMTIVDPKMADAGIEALQALYLQQGSQPGSCKLGKNPVKAASVAFSE